MLHTSANFNKVKVRGDAELLELQEQTRELFPVEKPVKAVAWDQHFSLAQDAFRNLCSDFAWARRTVEELCVAVSRNSLGVLPSGPGA
jgi:hypothetical protein